MQELERDLERALRECVYASLGVEIARLEALPAGLSTRRFFRITTRCGQPRTLIARLDAPEDSAGRPAGAAPEPPLVPIQRFLARHGLPVPRRYSGDPQQGIELLEDVGELALADAVQKADAAQRTQLYRAACSLIPRFQQAAEPSAPVTGLLAFQRKLDASMIRYKAQLFCTLSLPLAFGRPARRGERECVASAFAHIADECDRAPQRLAHRDFQSRNLHVRWPSDGIPMLAVLDFQGAFLAPPEYDLVCLLRDSYVEIPESEVQARAEEVRPQLPDAPEQKEFWNRMDLITLVRKAKDHARFVYAAHHRGALNLREYLPRTARMLRAAAARAAARNPRLTSLSALMARLAEAPCAP